jgi:Protein of unknown function (DUF2851)
MKEDFLHYVWKLQLLTSKKLLSSTKEPLFIINQGQQNFEAGPDFFNAKIKIGNQLWVGNIEIHVKATDWYVHHHETDPNYDSVILHVVWENDAEIFRSDNTPITTLVLKNYLPKSVWFNYKRLFSKSETWINCEKHIVQTDSFILDNWLECLFIERLEQKALYISELLNMTKNDWEAVLFILLAKNFGLKVNGESFLNMAKSTDFNIVRKVRTDKTALEALLFGQGHLLDIDTDNEYFKKLKEVYTYQKIKFSLQTTFVSKVQFFRLRPDNFPTIRLAQLSALYHRYQNLFSQLINIKNIQAVYDLLNIEISDFWQHHYTFTSETTGKRHKKLSKPFIDLLIINTLIPLQFVYQRNIGKLDSEKIIAFIKQLKPEKNSIVDKFKVLGMTSADAFNTQALLQLKNNYCTKNRCLDCKIGTYLIAN